MRGKIAPRAGGARREQFQQPPLGARKPVAGPRELLEMAPQRRREKRQRRGVAVEQLLNRPRVRRAERLPRRLRERELRRANGLARAEQRRQLRRRQLAEAPEVVVTRKRVDGDERRARRAARQRREPREELNQVELIEQVVLVPEHQLVERITGGNGGSPARQLGGGVVGRHAGGSRPGGGHGPREARHRSARPERGRRATRRPRSTTGRAGQRRVSSPSSRCRWRRGENGSRSDPLARSSAYAGVTFSARGPFGP